MFYDSNKPQMHFFSPIKLKTNNNCCEGCSRKYNEQVFQTHFSAGVAKLVDAVDSKSTAFGCAGSSPAFGTKNQTLEAFFLCLNFMIYKLFPSHPVFLVILKSIYIKYLLLHVVGISVLVSLDSIMVCTKARR